jgi:hypothetical protein
MISFVLNLVALAATWNIIAGRGGMAYLRARLAHDAQAVVDPS